MDFELAWLGADPMLDFSLNRSVRMEGELTSVKVSHDSRYALINRALDTSGSHCVSAGFCLSQLVE